MSRLSRTTSITAALALALLPAGYAATAAYADSAEAVTAPAFTVSQTATGFDVTIAGTGATVSFTVTPTGAVEAVDSEADEEQVDLPDPATTSAVDAQGDNNEQQGDNNDSQGDNNEQQGDNKDSKDDNSEQAGDSGSDD